MSNDYMKSKGWLTPAERKHLFDLASRVKPMERIVNIGIEYGASVTCLRAGSPNSYIYAIDIIGASKLATPVYADYIRSDSAKIAYSWPFGDIKLVFVDGDHTTNGVVHDSVFSSYVPKGGVICFHDCFNSPAATAVNRGVEIWLNKGKEYYSIISGDDYDDNGKEWKELKVVDSIRTFRRMK